VGSYRSALSLVFGILALFGCGTATGESGMGSDGGLVFSSLDGETIPASLFKPDGEGPFPAIVIVHDCSGLGARSSGAPARWRRQLVDDGYVVIVPDSFTPRGFPGGVCTVPGRDSTRVRPAVRAADAYGALAYLRTLPYVDGQHIGVMGGSHGGSTTLATMVAPYGVDRLADAKHDGFAAAIALYPGCGNRFGEWNVDRQGGFVGPITGYHGTYKPTAPLLILIGEKDDWTPAEPCQRMVETAQAEGYPLTIKVYPDALHSFDSYAPQRYVAERSNQNAPGAKGATTGGNPTAWADAKVEVSAFFRRYLKGGAG
jgi:dienelactone hydrolase